MTKGNMQPSVFVVMYHYVRPIQRSRYPEIKGLEYEGFKRQIKYLSENYQVLDLNSFMTILSDDSLIERPSVLLTFDDGFTDHLYHVLPELSLRGIQGCFYPPSRPVLLREMLDVHRIHFTLASTRDVDSVLNRLTSLMNEHLGSKKTTTLIEEAAAQRFDSPAITVIKRLLQRDLPMKLRTDLCEELFREFVSVDEKAFVEEIYMNTDQLRFMQECGMHIGSHGFSHDWLSQLSFDEQKSELQSSLEMLELIGHDTSKGWTLAYPYGDFNEDTLNLSSELGCTAAFTTVVGPATMDNSNRMTLERMDTNDFPR